MLTSPNFDFDSTPGDGAGDDYDTVNFTVSGTRVAGTPPTLVCPAGTRLFDWDTVAWTAGSLSNSYAVTGIGNIGFTLATTGAWVNDATYGGLSPTRTTAINGGFTGQTSLVQYIDFANRSQVSTATITLPTAVPGAQFRLLDVDFAANDFADRVVVTGTFNGSPVTPTLTNGTANYVISNTAIGDQGADNATAQGTVVVTFASPVDTIVITYGNHTTAPTNPDGQAMGLHDITFCNPQATLSVTKISNVVSDPFSPSNPKAIPGAVIRYCILVTNPGSATAANIASTDTLTANLTFVPGSMLSGTSCVGATTAEDDNNTGGDESDPFGMSRAGNVITGVTATLAPSASFAMVFNATVN